MRKYIGIGLMMILGALLLTRCLSNGIGSDSKPAPATSSRASSKAGPNISLREFDDIELGDLLYEDTRGLTKTQALAQFGQPRTSKKDTTEWQTGTGKNYQFNTETLTWGGVNENNATLTLSFIDGQAWSKSLAGMTQEQATISPSSFNNLVVGQTYSGVIHQLGQPAGLNEQRGNHEYKIAGLWYPKASDTSKYVYVLFTDGQLVSKAPTKLETDE